MQGSGPVPRSLIRSHPSSQLGNIQSVSHAGLSLPLAERLADQVLALPIYPTLPVETVAHVAELIQIFEQQNTAQP